MIKVQLCCDKCGGLVMDLPLVEHKGVPHIWGRVICSDCLREISKMPSSTLADKTIRMHEVLFGTNDATSQT